MEKEFTLSKAALIAGLGLLVMVLTVPFAEFYIFPKLITDDAVRTTNNIINNKMLFTTSIFLHFITLLCDIIVAWALYIFFKPVNKEFSLFTAWFRIVYAAAYLIVLVNLIKILSLIGSSNFTNDSQHFEHVIFYLDSFNLERSFGLIIFAIYLMLLGFLAFKSNYVPRAISILIIVAGLGYFIHTLGAFLIPDTNLDILFFTFFGELVFMVWLLIKGRKVTLNKTNVQPGA